MDIGGTVVPNTAPHTIFLCVELSISSSTEFSTFLAGSNTQNGAHGFTFGTLSGQTNQLWQWIVDNTTGDNDFTSVSGTGQLQNDTNMQLYFWINIWLLDTSTCRKHAQQQRQSKERASWEKHPVQAYQQS